MSVEPLPDWVRRTGGFVASDLDDLPGSPPHTELVDGGLVFVGPHRQFHMATLRCLENGLVRAATTDLYVAREMSVVLDERQRPEPDITVVDHGVTASTATWYPASAVHLVVEVVSPESAIRDRERKPQLYARAGVPHFWRVEENDGKPVVYVYELDPATTSYVATGIFHDRVKVAVPFAVDIDLTTFDQR